MCDNISSTALLIKLNFTLFSIGENVYLALKPNWNFSLLLAKLAILSF